MIARPSTGPIPPFSGRSEQSDSVLSVGIFGDVGFLWQRRTTLCRSHSLLENPIVEAALRLTIAQNLDSKAIIG